MTMRGLRGSFCSIRFARSQRFNTPFYASDYTNCDGSFLSHWFCLIKKRWFIFGLLFGWLSRGYWSSRVIGDSYRIGYGEISRHCCRVFSLLHLGFALRNDRVCWNIRSWDLGIGWHRVRPWMVRMLWGVGAQVWSDHHIVISFYFIDKSFDLAHYFSVVLVINAVEWADGRVVSAQGDGGLLRSPHSCYMRVEQLDSIIFLNRLFVFFCGSSYFSGRCQTWMTTSASVEEAHKLHVMSFSPAPFILNSPLRLEF